MDAPTLPQEARIGKSILRLTRETDGVVYGVRTDPTGSTMRFKTSIEAWLWLCAAPLPTNSKE